MKKIYYAHTKAQNGGFGVLGKGIYNALKSRPDLFTMISNEQCNFPDKTDPSKYQAIPQVDIVFTYGMPDLFDYVTIFKRVQKKIYGVEPKHVHYFVWESSELPKDFIKVYKTADQLLTATAYMANCARKQGLKAKVWHHAVDARFAYREPLNDGIFTFLHHNAFEYRKGWELVLLAFLKEFGADEPVRLVMKGRERKHGVWIIPKQKPYTAETWALYKSDKEAYLQLMGKLQGNIVELIGHVSDDEMVKMNAEADCFLFPAKGEGWGLPPFEAMAMGIVPILPNKGCFTEFFNKDAMLDVEIAGYLHAAPRYPGYLYQVSEKDLRRKMRWAFENQDKIKEMGKIGSEYIHREFNWPKVIEEFYNLTCLEK